MINSLRRNTRRVASVLRREFRYYFPRPTEVNLELTHRCNLRCRMCGVWGKKTDGGTPELTLAEYTSLFAQMKSIGVRLVTLAGGEPFIRSDLFDIIRAAKAQGLICNLFSNGTLIERSQIEALFASGVDKIIVSIDGVGPVHDAVRGIPGTFAKAMNALDGLVAERRLRKTKHPEIDIHMTVLGENVSSLVPLQAACDTLGINFSFQPYTETSVDAVEETRLNGNPIGTLRYMPHQASLRFTDDQVLQMRSAFSRLPRSFYTKLLMSFSREQLKQGLIPVGKCYVTRNFMMIDPYGRLYPCTNLERYVVGSVREQPLSAIWAGEKYAALRKKLALELLPICAHCCHCADNLALFQLIGISISRA